MDETIILKNEQGSSYKYYILMRRGSECTGFNGRIQSTCIQQKSVNINNFYDTKSKKLKSGYEEMHRARIEDYVPAHKLSVIRDFENSVSSTVKSSASKTKTAMQLKREREKADKLKLEEKKKKEAELKFKKQEEEKSNIKREKEEKIKAKEKVQTEKIASEYNQTLDMMF